MFNFMMDKILKSLLKKKRKKQRIYKDLSAIRTVLVLFEAKDFETSEAFIKNLKKLGKQVHACGYVAKGDTRDYTRTFYRMIFPKADINWFGKPSHSLISFLNETPCDAVIDLSIEQNITLDYLVSSIKSPLKIGMKKNNYPIYDFCISPGDDISNETINTAYLGKQILFYLKTVHSA